MQEERKETEAELRCSGKFPGKRRGKAPEALRGGRAPVTTWGALCFMPPAPLGTNTRLLAHRGARHRVLSPPAPPWKPLSYFFFLLFFPLFWLGSAFRTPVSNRRGLGRRRGAPKPSPWSLCPRYL